MFLAWSGITRLVVGSSGHRGSRGTVGQVSTGAPQLSTTQVQGEALQAALGRRGIDARYYIAMRYWSPTTTDALEEDACSAAPAS